MTHWVPQSMSPSTELPETLGRKKHLAAGSTTTWTGFQGEVPVQIELVPQIEDH